MVYPEDNCQQSKLFISTREKKDHPIYLPSDLKGRFPIITSFLLKGCGNRNQFPSTFFSFSNNAILSNVGRGKLYPAPTLYCRDTLPALLDIYHDIHSLRDPIRTVIDDVLLALIVLRRMAAMVVKVLFVGLAARYCNPMAIFRFRTRSSTAK